MKITNLEELIKLMEYYFSDKSSKINSSEEKIMKEQIKNVIEKIDEAPAKIKETALYELKAWKQYCSGPVYEGRIELVKFICECLHEEDIIQLIKKYLQSKTTNSGTKYSLQIDREHLLTLLDYLSDESKIIALTYASPVDLIRIMGEINEISKDWKENLTTRKYYKKYYNIFTKVLEKQNKN